MFPYGCNPAEVDLTSKAKLQSLNRCFDGYGLLVYVQICSYVLVRGDCVFWGILMCRLILNRTHSHWVIRNWGAVQPPTQPIKILFRHGLPSWFPSSSMKYCLMSSRCACSYNQRHVHLFRMIQHSEGDWPIDMIPCANPRVARCFFLNTCQMLSRFQINSSDKNTRRKQFWTLFCTSDGHTQVIRVCSGVCLSCPSVDHTQTLRVWSDVCLSCPCDDHTQTIRMCSGVCLSCAGDEHTQTICVGSGVCLSCTGDDHTQTIRVCSGVWAVQVMTIRRRYACVLVFVLSCVRTQLLHMLSIPFRYETNPSFNGNQGLLYHRVNGNSIWSCHHCFVHKWRQRRQHFHHIFYPFGAPHCAASMQGLTLRGSVVII